MRYKEGGAVLDYVMNSELYHHGILGQKWGVRRYQNEDGTLTEQGREHYGYGEYESEKDRINRVAKGAVIAGGVLATVGAVAVAKQVVDKNEKDYNSVDKKVYDLLTSTDMGKNIVDEMKRGTNSIMDLDADYVIPAGTDIWNIGKNPNGPSHQSKWMSINQHDADFYKGIYTKIQNERAGESSPSYQSHYVNDKDIKGAGKAVASKVFLDQYKHDKEFQKDFWNKVDFHTEWHPESFSKMRDELKEAERNKNRSIVDHINYNKKMRDIGYEFFNVGLTDHGEATSKLTGTKYNFYYDSGKKFYDELIKKGYGSIRDVNDMKYSTFHTYNPQIMFNTDKDLRKIETRQLTNDEVNKAARDNSVVYGTRLAGHFNNTLRPVNKGKTNTKTTKKGAKR